MVRGNIWKRAVCLAVTLAFFGTFVTGDVLAQGFTDYPLPGQIGSGQSYTEGRYVGKDGTSTAGVNRALFGAAGLAAGAFGGTALAGAITAAAGGALVGLPGVIVTTCIVAGLGLVGAKLGSHVGAWADAALGPQMQWTLLGASVGAMLALMLLPAFPWAGAMAPMIKVLLGGTIGGLLGRFFAPQLQSVATPKLIYAGLGGFVGGLAFGIPGALVGVAGGFVLGGLFDKSFFSTPGMSVGEDLGVSGLFGGLGRITDWFKNRAADIKDWVGNKTDQFKGRMQDQWYEDPSYQYVGNQAGYNFNPNADQYYKDGNYSYQTQYPTQQTYSGYNSNQDLQYLQNQRNNSYNNFRQTMESGNTYNAQNAYGDYINWATDYQNAVGRGY